MALGANEYLTKPIQANKVLANREFSFALYPPKTLRSFMQSVEA